MNNKKSQAGIEFLSTYGWTILVIVLMIGIMTYFSMDLEDSAPEQFILGDVNIEHFALSEPSDTTHGFGFQVYSGTFGKLIFNFQNPELDEIILNNLSFTVDNSELVVECLPLGSILPGQSQDIECWLCKNDGGSSCTDFLSQNTKTKIVLEIKYKIADKTFTKVSSGSIYAQATETTTTTPAPQDECNNFLHDDTDGKMDQEDYSCHCGSLESETKQCGYDKACYMIDGDDCAPTLLCDEYWLTTPSQTRNIGICKYDSTAAVECRDNDNCARDSGFTCIGTGNSCSRLIRFMDRGCDTGDDEDCEGAYICDSVNFCKIALGDPCRTNDQCAEGTTCSIALPQTCIPIIVTP